MRPPWKHPSVRRITRPSLTCCQAPQALGLRGRGREGAPSPPAHVQVSLPGMLGEAGVGGGLVCGKRREPRRDVYQPLWGQAPRPELGPTPKQGDTLI